MWLELVPIIHHFLWLASFSLGLGHAHGLSASVDRWLIHVRRSLRFSMIFFESHYVLDARFALIHVVLVVEYL